MFAQKRTCSNCIRGTSITVNGDVLCRDKGAVDPSYCCIKHKYAPTSKLTKEKIYKCINCENFIIQIGHSRESHSIGLCQLFSVRQYDGKQKNACSKFAKRANLEVS
jgi:hypothetical protein